MCEACCTDVKHRQMKVVLLSHVDEWEIESSSFVSYRKYIPKLHNCKRKQKGKGKMKKGDCYSVCTWTENKTCNGKFKTFHPFNLQFQLHEVQQYL